MSNALNQIIRLPGMVDMHVHMREPGGLYKEDWVTGTSAAVAGGVVAVVDMPNTNPPTLTVGRLEEKEKIAKEKSFCDYGFYLGSDGSNLGEFQKVYDRVLGLKLYLGETTGAPHRHSRPVSRYGVNSSGNPEKTSDDDFVFVSGSSRSRSGMTLEQEMTGSLLLEDEKKIADIFKAWSRGKPILVHAEGERLKLAIQLAEKNYQKLHCCHVASKEDIVQVAKAKAKGVQVTCEVAPHHLFLTQKDVERLGPFGLMKPELGTEQDQAALWEHIQKGTVDCVATDHAPHTRQEKLAAESRGTSRLPVSQTNAENVKVPFGVPGLETALPLLVTAMEEGKLTREQLINLTSVNPWRILGSRPPVQTSVEIETGISYQLDEAQLKTKCGWSPFVGLTLKARVVRTVIHGVEVYKDGKMMAKEGIGRNII